MKTILTTFFLAVTFIGTAQTQKCINDYNAGVQAKREKRYSTALSLFKKAADDCGMDYAYIALGKMYYNGVGVDKDWCKALEWFNKARYLDNDASAMKKLITSDGNNPCDGRPINYNAPLFGTWDNTTKNNSSNTAKQNKQKCNTKEFSGTKIIDNKQSLEFSITFCTKGFYNNNSTLEEKFVTLKIKQKQTKNGVTNILKHESLHSVKSTVKHPNMTSARKIELSLSKIEKEEVSISNIFDLKNLKLVYYTDWDDNKIVRLLNRNGFGFVDLKDVNQDEEDGSAW